MELSRAANETGYKSVEQPFRGVDFKLANGTAQLLFTTYEGGKELLQDYTLWKQDALAATPRCCACAHFEAPEDDVGIGGCEFHGFLTGEERACSRFQEQDTSEVR